jgi:hypothetical protein
MQNIDQKISELQTRLAQLKAKQQAAVARERAKTSAEKRKAETRSKILAGAYLIDIFGLEKLGQLALEGKSFDKYLTRDDDRLLFNLKPLPIMQEE